MELEPSDTVLTGRDLAASFETDEDCLYFLFVFSGIKMK